MRFLRMILLGLSAGGMVMPGAVLAQTQTLVDVATVSMSAPGMPRTVTNTVCATDGNDLVCDRGVYITPAGRIGIGTNSPLSTLDVSGTNMRVISEYSENSPHINLINKAGEDRGTFGPGITFDNGISGTKPYIIQVYQDTNNIFSINQGVSPYNPFFSIVPSGEIGIGGVLDPKTKLHIWGTIRIADSGEICDADRTGAIRFTGGDFWFCRNGSAWESMAILSGGGGLADRIVSGTSAVVVNSATGIISISQLGAVASYVHPSLGYVGPGVSTTGPISGTNGYFSGNVGIGTATPSTTLHVVDNSAGRSFFDGASGVGSGIILRGARSGPNAIQQGDLIGVIGARPFIENNYSNTSSAWISFRAASNNSASDLGSNITFATTPVSATSGIERMIITEAGRVGIDTVYPSTNLHVSGTLRLANGGEACDANRTGAIRFTGGDFWFCRNGSAWESMAILSGGGGLADRIVSGTSAVVMNSATGIISISQLGAVASYVHPSIGYVGPGVSTTGAVSTTRVYLAATPNQCATAADIGSMFRSATTGKLQICADRN